MKTYRFTYEVKYHEAYEIDAENYDEAREKLEELRGNGEDPRDTDIINEEVVGEEIVTEKGLIPVTDEGKPC